MTKVVARNVLTEAMSTKKKLSEVKSMIKFSSNVFRVFMMSINDKNGKNVRLRQVPKFACY